MRPRLASGRTARPPTCVPPASAVGGSNDPGEDELTLGTPGDERLEGARGGGVLSQAAAPFARISAKTAYLSGRRRPPRAGARRRPGKPPTGPAPRGLRGGSFPGQEAAGSAKPGAVPAGRCGRGADAARTWPKPGRARMLRAPGRSGSSPRRERRPPGEPPPTPPPLSARGTMALPAHLSSPLAPGSVASGPVVPASPETLFKMRGPGLTPPELAPALDTDLWVAFSSQFSFIVVKCT